ncbi:MAG TPA: hypothetical protein VFZ28_00145 [Burkholderiaceae bacterium]|nr:hypothetical protein [Burkholderiaceae bacterium]
MHTGILGVATLAAALLSTTAHGDETAARCPSTDAAVLERFISAECEACWSDASVAQPADGQWLLDWIVPSARGEAAPLSSAAPAEARDRAQRALQTPPTDHRASVQRSAARRASPLQLSVISGPAWYGYLAVQLDAAGRVAVGASVWVALVETVAPGTEGTAVPRELVRALAGPLPADDLRRGQPWQYQLAMRWPETAKPARLRARAWIEDARGRIVAMAGERCGVR